MMVVTNETGSH